MTPGSQSYVEMYQSLEREELYQLNTWVREGQSWKKETVINGQGPLISEERVYLLDVSNAPGDSLVLRFNPPRGFWTFDYIGVSYEEPTEWKATRVDARRAEDKQRTSILGSLDSIDLECCVMPEVGDWAAVSFSVPALSDGTARSVYLETTGYYELHLPKRKPDQLARLYDIWMNPGRIVKTAMEEFRTWQSELQATVGGSQGK